MFDEQEFVLVCRRNDYENGIIGDGLFLVSREEWEDTDDYSIKTFDLLLTSVENNACHSLFTLPNFGQCPFVFPCCSQPYISGKTASFKYLI